MQAEFKERDEEMDHKFSLQVAENKRLQGPWPRSAGEQALYAQVVSSRSRRQKPETCVCGECRASCYGGFLPLACGSWG